MAGSLSAPRRRSQPGCCIYEGWVSPIKDPGAASARQAANSGDLSAAVPAVLETLEPGLGTDEDFTRAVLSQAEALTTAAR
jgi:fructuronate reductase